MPHRTCQPVGRRSRIGIAALLRVRPGGSRVSPRARSRSARTGRAADGVDGRRSGAGGQIACARRGDRRGPPEAGAPRARGSWWVGLDRDRPTAAGGGVRRGPRAGGEAIGASLRAETNHSSRHPGRLDWPPRSALVQCPVSREGRVGRSGTGRLGATVEGWSAPPTGAGRSGRGARGTPRSARRHPGYLRHHRRHLAAFPEGADRRGPRSPADSR